MKNILLIFLLTFKYLLLSQAQECGQVKYTAGLIVNGTEIKRGEFPFLVAIRKVSDKAFICGGSLITKLHALTASHCIHEKYRSTRFSPEDLTVLVGKFDLRVDDESDSTEMKISEIIMHEDWNPKENRYDADIAILVFDKEVEFNNYIRTVCLPKMYKSNSLQSGDVVGWGVSERTSITHGEALPRKVKIDKPPPNDQCFLEDSYFAQISSTRTFCAGGKNAGPCFGDSGGGFYVRTSSGWHIQGLVSATVLTNNSTCDNGKYALYTNVAKYYDWIWKKTTALKFIQLPCNYNVTKKLKNNPYTCSGQIKVLSDNVNVDSTIGKHLTSKSNNDVSVLDLNSHHSHKVRDIHYIPEGLGKLFPNLKILYIQNCKLKSLSRNNFENMNHLSTISLTKNQIEHIDPDTFHDLPMLFSIRLNRNKLNILSNDLFIHAPKLKHAIFGNNSLEDFDSNIFESNKNLESLDLSNNKLNTINIDFPEFKDLHLVDLRNNKCINEIFYSSKSLNDFQDSIKKNCSKK